ncbi:MAG TPA: asparaginase [Ramlibacter sp.]|uniref:asparaginase n=1 Tax=Ramlibacter sp. TaxID=1917967 RepID=UPI002D6460C3|nr:asparaginase [Ramlibacter sp.]HZY19237.1 asparaginase [Ramlibacter sp.]
MTADQIVVLGTGGTIAGSADAPGDHVAYRAGQLAVEHLLQGIPALAGVRLVSEQIAQVDSKDITPATWVRLAERCAHWLDQPQVRGVVVTHGTDTLEETAYFLERVLGPRKPLVLTCAMRPATALSADGPQNIADAVSVARADGVGGVAVVCAGRIHAAADITKVHPYRLDPYSSGEAGPLGYVEDGRVRLVRPCPAPAAVASLRQIAGDRGWPRVSIVLSHAGADARLVELLLDDGVQGLVVAGTGNGTVHEALEAALAAAAERGIRVLRSTRCVEGRVVPHASDRWPAHPLSPVKARIDLLLQLLAA